VNTAVELILAFLLPTAAGFALMGGVRALRWAGETTVPLAGRGAHRAAQREPAQIARGA